MNINSAMQLECGGPGSGRHKEGGYKPPNRKEDEQAQKTFLKVAKQHGFKATKDPDGGKSKIFVKKQGGKYHILMPAYSDHGNKTYISQFSHSITNKLANYDNESKFQVISKHPEFGKVKDGHPSELHDYLTKKGL